MNRLASRFAAFAALILLSIAPVAFAQQIVGGGASGASGASIGPLLPNYLSGRWYMPPGLAISAGSNAMTSTTARIQPFQILGAKPVTIAQFGIRITTAYSGGNVDWAVYANNPATNLPMGNPIATSPSISTTAVGLAAVAPTQGSVTLAPGIYWFAVNADNSSVVMQCTGGTTPWQGAIVGGLTEAAIDSSNATALIGLQVSGITFGTWPNMTGQSLAEIAYCGAIPHWKVQ